MTDDWRNKRKTWSEKLQYFVTNVDEGDVIFVVGSSEEEKREIKAVKFLLRVVSPVFERMFSAEWSEKSRIELPDIQPDIFQVFLQLLPRDKIDSALLAALNLQIETVLGLLYVAKKYQTEPIHSASIQYIKENISVSNALIAWEHVQTLDEKELESDVGNFIAENMTEVVKEQKGFSKDVLVQILKSEDICIPETLLFQGVRSWAEFQCEEAGLKKTGENMRSVLGEALFLIRFPLLSAHDFVNNVRPKGILTTAESLGVLEWILSTNENREAMEMTEFPFSYNLRKSQTRETPLYENVGKRFHFPLDGTNAPFRCITATKIDVDLKADRDIKIYSFGFYGPMLKNSVFEVSIHVGKELVLSKKIFAWVNKIFYVEFDSPVLVRGFSQLPYPRVSIMFKGEETPRSCITSLTDDGITFYYNYGRPGPIAEWRYDEV